MSKYPRINSVFDNIHNKHPLLDTDSLIGIILADDIGIEIQIWVHICLNISFSGELDKYVLLKIMFHIKSVVLQNKINNTKILRLLRTR